jgi:hypothetical protein
MDYEIKYPLIYYRIIANLMLKLSFSGEDMQYNEKWTINS